MEKIKAFREKTKKIRVLYVEDNKYERDATYAVLNTLLGTVMSAENAEDALAFYKRYAIQFYDIVLTDVNMGKMNGLELVKEIKRYNPQQKMILLTSQDNLGDEAKNLGVSEYVVKPIRLDSLMHTIDRVLDL